MYKIVSSYIMIWLRKYVNNYVKNDPENWFSMNFLKVFKISWFDKGITVLKSLITFSTFYVSIDIFRALDQ